ncbi:MAG: 30S ribosome-binding factor RbfA [bacterium]
MQFKRAERVAVLIREEVSKIIQFEISDPRIGFVTVTAVDLSDDLLNAKIYCGILGDTAAVRASLAALIESAWFIRKELAGRIKMRRAPEISFHLDERAEKAARIDTLLRKIHSGDVAEETSDDVATGRRRRPRKSTRR